MIAKWANEINERLKRNPNDYFSSDVFLEVQESKEARDAVNSYCSMQIAEKQKMIAQVVIDKWAEEQITNFKNNPHAFDPK